MSSSTDANGSQQLDPALVRYVLVLVTGAVLALVNTTVVGVALPTIRDGLDTTQAAASWVGTAFVLALAVAIPLSGWSIVRNGVRRTWLVAMSTFALGSLLAALAPTVGWLVGARVVQGLGGGMLEPVMLTAAAQAAGPRRMGRVMAIVAAVIASGPLLGPLLGGVVIQDLDWRWLFAAFVPLALLSLVASHRLLPHDAGVPSRLDVVGLSLVAGGGAAALYGLSQGAGPSGVTASGWLAIAVGVLLFAGYAAWARRLGPAAIVSLRPAREPGYLPAAVVMLLLGAAIYPVFFGLPQFFQGARGLSVIASGAMLAPHGLGALVGMTIGGRLSDRRSSRALAVGGALVAALGSGVWVVLGSDAPLWAYALASVVFGAGTGFVGGPTMSSLYRSLPPELIPSGSTMLFVLNQLGGAAGIAVMAVLIGPVGWTAAIGTTPVVLPLVGLLVVVAVASRLPGGRPGATEPMPQEQVEAA